MLAVARDTATQRYERCIKTSKRVRWDIDADVIHGRCFGLDKHFLPEGLSRVARFSALLNAMLDDAQRARIGAALEPMCSLQP